MRVLLNRDAHRTLRWLQVSLYAAAAICLGFYAWFRLDGIYHQQRLKAQFESQRASPVTVAVAHPPSLPSDRPPSAGEAATAAAASETGSSRDAGEEELLGRLTVPRIGLDVVVLAKDDERSLRLGAGHVQGTALPEQPGNIGIAAHRDTFFRPLRDIRKDDLIHLSTTSARQTYKVEWIAVVEPTQVSVLDPTPEPSLTLVTCFPFDYVGRAPQRYIVRAQALPASDSGRGTRTSISGE